MSWAKRIQSTQNYWHVLKIVLLIWCVWLYLSSSRFRSRFPTKVGMLWISLTYVTCFVRLILLHSITRNLKLSLSCLLYCYFPFALFLLSLEVSDFSRSVVDFSAVRGCCTARVGSWLPIIGITSVPSWRLILEDGTDILSRNVSYQLPTYAEQHSRKTKTTSSLFSRKR